MAHKFAEIAFTDSVKAIQQAMGSRDAYRHMEEGADVNRFLGPHEAEFIAARDSFYMATVGETGWPYVQHRGGPKGFVRVLDPSTIGFADFRGNRQYVSAGNLSHDDRVSLIFVDYPNRARLKLLGHARVVDPADGDVIDGLALPDYRARVERSIVIAVDGFDWNCPQHITPRFTVDEAGAELAALRRRVRELEAKLRSG